MRGRDDQSDGLFSYVRLEKRIPDDHPLRPIRKLVDEVLGRMNGRLDALYAGTGRPSIAPEMLLRATLLQAFFSVRSERQLMEQIDYNLLFRWFVGLPMDAQVWHATVFCHNRDRLLEADVAREFLVTLMGLAEVTTLLSREHFSVDGTLIEAWASMKSFQPRDGSGEPPGPGRNGERNFHKEKRSNETHASTTDPDARLYRKADGRESKLCFMGHVVMENRNGLAVDASLSLATGTAEREATLDMLDRRSKTSRRITLGADKAYDVTDFIADLRGSQGDTAYRHQWRCLQAWKGAQNRHRQENLAPCGLRHQPALPQTHRRGLRLGEEAWRPCQGQAARPRKGRSGLHLHLHCRRLHSDPHTETHHCRSLNIKRNGNRRQKAPTKP
jgi:transposase